MCSTYQLTLHRYASLTVGYDAHRLSDLVLLYSHLVHSLWGKAHIKQRVISQHRTYAAEDSRVTMSHKVYILSCLLSCYPLAIARGSGYLAVKRHRPLSRHPRHGGRYIFQEHAVLVS